MTQPCLKMRHPADMLAMHYFAATGQMKGEFFQETEPPWNVWWKPGSEDDSDAGLERFFKSTEEDPATLWRLEHPPESLKKASWADLFRNFVLRPDESSRMGDLLILKTSEKKFFLDVIRRHFLLQQGLMDFCRFETGTPVWLLRIRNPSVWAFEALPPPDPKTYELFCQVPGSEGLFVESGWNLSDPANGLRLNHFRFMEKNCLLVKRSGEIENYVPSWVHSSSIIEISCPAPSVLQTEESEKITIKPVLRDTEEVTLHSLWKVDDVARFQAILSNESLNRFSGFSAWYGKDRTIWLFSSSDLTDRGIASLFSDAFRPFSRLERNVFLPAGKVLSPRLSEDRLKQIFGCPREDSLCLEMEEQELRATQLPKTELKQIDFFVTFQAEHVLKNFESFKTQWVFDFPEVKKK